MCTCRFATTSATTVRATRSSRREKGVARQYLDRLNTEIALQSELVGSKRPITQMHWGGGTPTYLDNAEITELMHMLASHFRLLDKATVSTRSRLIRAP